MRFVCKHFIAVQKDILQEALILWIWLTPLWPCQPCTAYICCKLCRVQNQLCHNCASGIHASDFNGFYKCHSFCSSVSLRLEKIHCQDLHNFLGSFQEEREKQICIYVWDDLWHSPLWFSCWVLPIALCRWSAAISRLHIPELIKHITDILFR